ncbi:MAG TPA: hypothetical protein VE645_01540 [Pseudonocardiaceae bacterium]|nr:hypothetical protein [Pseudonocardiaceae bacterium]
MDIYTGWWGDRHRVIPLRCAAPVSPVNHVGPGVVGLFFTGGVDSFYSLLKDVELSTDAGHEPVTHLLYANIGAHHGRAYGRLVGRLRRAAEETDRQLVLIDTNVQSLTDRAVYWPDYYGAALASVALALQGLFGRCLIAASDHYRHLPPLGSHPVVDHLWSTERLEIVHDGAEATRTDKVVRQIGRSRLALETKRVLARRTRAQLRDLREVPPHHGRPGDGRHLGCVHDPAAHARHPGAPRRAHAWRAGTRRDAFGGGRRHKPGTARHRRGHRGRPAAVRRHPECS